MSRIGSELRRLRRVRGLDLYATGNALGVSGGHLQNVEYGTKTCGKALAERAADFFKLVGNARTAFLALRTEVPQRAEAEPVLAPLRPLAKRLPLARVTCAGGCNHDGRLAPGGSEDGHERDNKCAHYDHCLAVFTKAHPAARSCHCPQRCPKRTYHTAPALAAAGWGSFTFPSHGGGKGRAAR